jgi:small subunit ribosomal protein S17|tara:strand:+ start:615 stop:872 length:258 start_codon:yes stop_codon:yes gene_type:complete
MAGNRRQLIGNVIPSKMDKTVVVEVARRFPHPVYQKYVTRTKKYYAHDPEGKCTQGDIVKIEESKPLSKLKRWRVVSIEQKSVEI